ncbi:MAG: hypothetical protein ACTSWY_15985, partial [Promethearchaeota archaeon]
ICCYLNMEVFPHQTIITYFDVFEGPRLLLSDFNSGENNPSSFQEDEITRLMDIHNSGEFFLHYYKNKISINYCFAIRDPETRGGEHSFMTSLIFHKEKEKENFAEIFKDMPNLERWVKSISKSLQNSANIKNLIGMKKYQKNWTKKPYTEIKNELIKSLKRNF